MQIGFRGVSVWLCALAMALAGCNGQVDGSSPDGARNQDEEASGDSDGSDSGEAAKIPAGCEGVLVHRSDLPECGGGCGVAEETPERVVEWRLSVEDSDGVTDDAFWHRVDCVEQQLVALGVTFESSGGEVAVVTSYAEIESVIHTTAIDSISAMCPGDDCACAEHDEETCKADPLCTPVSGARLDTGSACPTFVECVRYDSFCVWFTPARDEAGACWSFPSGCVPDGFTSQPLGTAGCSDADFEALAPCAD